MTQPKPFYHPNLAPEINKAIQDSEIAGGAWIDRLEVGKTLKIQTRSREYTLEHRSDGFYISGHPRFCPTPSKCRVHGSTWGGSMLKVGFVGIGMHLEVYIEDLKDVITTSEIQEVVEV